MKEALNPFRKKYHHDFYALKDVNFEIKKGETVGIIGQNGSGKSTLLKIITGVLTPSAGKVQVNGRVSALLELGAGFNPELTGIENVYFNGAIIGFSKQEMDAKIDDILSFADIGEFIYQPVKTYSSGMFVRLAFAVATQVDPEILIVDEALSVGDMRFQVKCHRKMDEFREAGKTFLFVSHSTSDVIRLCNKAIWLDKGKTQKQGAVKPIVEEYHAWMVHDTALQKTKIQIEQPNSEYDLQQIPKNAMINGEGGVEIIGVGFFDEDNKPIYILDGKKKVRIIMRCQVKELVNNPYFGFQIVNSKGIRLMGCNNIVINYKILPLKVNSDVEVSFGFVFPEIENGSYLIALGAADGTSSTHVRHQFIADAYEFQFLSLSKFQEQAVLFKIDECEITVDL